MRTFSRVMYTRGGRSSFGARWVLLCVSHSRYAALMTDNMTLGSWLSHSVVAHAVSTSGRPEGPYVVLEECVVCMCAMYCASLRAFRLHPQARETTRGSATPTK